MQEHQGIPPNTMIFLAQYVGNHFGILTKAGSGPLTIYPDTPDAIPTEAYSATFVIGQLALQIFSVRRPKDFAEPLSIKIPGRWDQCTIEIWPPRRLGNMAWPPPEVFDDEVLDTFMTRWATIRP